MQFSRGGPMKQKAKIVVIVTKVTTSSGTVMNLELIPVVLDLLKSEKTQQCI